MCGGILGDHPGRLPRHRHYLRRCRTFEGRSPCDRFCTFRVPLHSRHPTKAPISGGRGVNGTEKFSLIKALADSLGTAVGASWAAVDAGWYPQVGQTGKSMSTRLHVALSGADGMSGGTRF
ncbi:hypothetical protein SCOCK_50153 [Actinacidiphila cocklensis]|uniref:Electron transfer flavoprotein alpha subunit C-terminal domain-containing protein n=1 Tax=Actinacidiphila cocklensis TaxID=887465 RepID=A0A9W4GU19_9ACTN|nr:hypothetical protein SCOCK_50153 [Actinacidiphila cocklensis]